MGKILYILFYVNNNLYVVELMYISRIIEIGQVYPGLGNVSYIPGIIKVINDIWTVSGLRKRFGKEYPKTQGHLLGILLRYKDFKTCIVIDKVKSIIIINTAKITPQFDRNNYSSGTI